MRNFIIYQREKKEMDLVEKYNKISSPKNYKIKAIAEKKAKKNKDVEVKNEVLLFFYFFE